MINNKELDTIIQLMQAMVANDVRSVVCEAVTIERFEVIDDVEDDPDDGEKEPVFPGVVGLE